MRCEVKHKNLVKLETWFSCVQQRVKYWLGLQLSVAAN